MDVVAPSDNYQGLDWDTDTSVWRLESSVQLLEVLLRGGNRIEYMTLLNFFIWIVSFGYGIEYCLLVLHTQVMEGERFSPNAPFSADVKFKLLEFLIFSLEPIQQNCLFVIWASIGDQLVLKNIESFFSFLSLGGQLIV